MTDRPPSIQRRHFLTAAGTTGLAGLAGCSALVDSNSKQPTEESDLTDDSPTQLVEQYLEVIATQRQTVGRMYHSQIDRTFDLEIQNTAVVEEDLSVSALRSRSTLSEETLETIANNAETAVVEAEFAVTNRGNQDDETLEFVLATEDGDWRLIGGPSSGDSEDGSSEETSETAEDSEPSPEPGIPEPVHEYLVKNETVGYDGALVDRRSEDSVTIEVGAGENGFAFSPPVIKVETGTEVVWEWTGNGGAHNVVSTEAPEYFSTTEVVAEEGHTWSRVFETAGNYMYHCEPHHALGMHGAIIVE